jgi:hypothetical protein
MRGGPCHDRHHPAPALHRSRRLAVPRGRTGSDNLKVVGAELGHGAAQEQHAIAASEIHLGALRCRAQCCQWIEARVEADQFDNVLGWIEVGDCVVAGSVGEAEDIGAIVAGQDVITAPAFDDVRRVPADHYIVARIPKQPVTGCGTLRRCRECPNEVISGTTVDLVSSNVAAQDGIIAAIAKYNITMLDMGSGGDRAAGEPAIA